MFCVFTEICAKRKSNGLIRAEPPELHFSGFELQKEYTQTLVRRPTFLFQAAHGLLKRIKYAWFVLVLNLLQRSQFIAVKSNENLSKWTAKTQILSFLIGSFCNYLSILFLHELPKE